MAAVTADSPTLTDSSATLEESGIQPEPPQEERHEDESTAEGESEGRRQEERSDSNVYRYIKDDLFTSEIFKVEIQNLPKYIGFNDLKKFLNKHGLNPHKIKLMGKQTFAFVTFKNQVGFEDTFSSDFNICKGLINIVTAGGQGQGHEAGPRHAVEGESPERALGQAQSRPPAQEAQAGRRGDGRKTSTQTSRRGTRWRRGRAPQCPDRQRGHAPVAGPI